MGKTVCFFGHRNTPQDVKPMLHDTLIDLIENQGADTFYVGNQGGFDSMVYSELKKLAEIYPHITYSVVLAYMPGKKLDYEFVDYGHTIANDSRTQYGFKRQISPYTASTMLAMRQHYCACFLVYGKNLSF